MPPDAANRVFRRLGLATESKVISMSRYAALAAPVPATLVFLAVILGPVRRKKFVVPVVVVLWFAVLGASIPHLGETRMKGRVTVLAREQVGAYEVGW